MESRTSLPAIARTLSSFVLMLLALLLVTFLIGKASPIDPVIKIVGDRATAEAYEQARRGLGLDKPVALQFVAYVGRAVQGDLGNSTSTGRPVLEDLLQYFPRLLNSPPWAS